MPVFGYTHGLIISQTVRKVMNKRPSPPENTALPLDASTLDGLPNPVCLIGQSLIIVDYNRAAPRLLGEMVLGARLDKTIRWTGPTLSRLSVTLSTAHPTREAIFFCPMP